jgi:hypothetical protein
LIINCEKPLSAASIHHIVIGRFTMLKEIEYLWAVTYTSRDDGHRLTAAVFTDRKEADKYCRERAFGIDQKVVQSSLWMDTDSGKYYEVTKREVDVDGPVHRERAWAKLSPAERNALGVTSR